MKSIYKITFVLLVSLGLLMTAKPIKSDQKLQTDQNMQTKQYRTDIVLKDNGAYFISETIDVHFNKPQHGIYRDIPVRGVQEFTDEKNQDRKFLYYADVKIKDVNTVNTSMQKNGVIVLRLGDQKKQVRNGCYKFSYDFVPYYQEEDYHYIYYNVFPGQWRNPIPKGSRFTIRFPSSVSLSNFKFYYGQKGQTRDAANVADITINKEGREITGIMKKELPAGWGLTCFGNLGEGYFKSVNRPSFGIKSMLTAAVCLVALIVMYLIFGRDSKIIPSIQYHPPDGMDSAAAGYIIDGKADDKDIISLLLYWADKGYVFLKEEGEGITIYKIKDLSPHVPEYQKFFFEQLFTHEEPFLSTKNVPDRMEGAVIVSRTKLKNYFQNQLFTKQSRIARPFAMLLAIVPMATFVFCNIVFGILNTEELLAGLCIFAAVCIGFLVLVYTADRWYSLSKDKREWLFIIGIIVCVGAVLIYMLHYILLVATNKVFNNIQIMFFICAVTLVGIILAIFMRRRTEQCKNWMGYLVGFRDFIEVAELDRLEDLGKQYPNLFYHIFPYTYVFGLSEIFAEKLQALKVEMPYWFGTEKKDSIFEYRPFENFGDYLSSSIGSSSFWSSKSHLEEGNSSDGGFFSGDFSDGGGSSGGGFGGGGGGSW